MVRVRKMEWDSRYQAYSFTTEEEPRITIIWTPDNDGVNTPSDTGNQTPPALPGTVIVDPLPDIPPIYIYLSKPPLEFLEVELYSDFKRRSRQGQYEADHMPSRAAVEKYLKELNPELGETELRSLSDYVSSIVIPKEVHQKLNMTNPRPLSVGIIDAVTAELNESGAGGHGAVRFAMRSYIGNIRYIRALAAGGARYNLKEGEVTAEQRQRAAQALKTMMDKKLMFIDGIGP
jgi:hypothetical protein